MEATYTTQNTTVNLPSRKEIQKRMAEIMEQNESVADLVTGFVMAYQTLREADARKEQ